MFVNKKKWHRLLSLVLVLTMALTLAPVGAFANSELSLGDPPTATAPGGSETPTPSPEGTDTTDGENAPDDTVLPVYTLTIEYFYGESENQDLNYKQAAQPYVASLKQGDAYEVASPSIAGFAPDQAVVKSGEGGIQADTNLQVVYTPADTAYTVRHVFEGREQPVVETLSGKTGAFTAAAAKQETGYDAQPFEQQKISADGATEVVIRYLLQRHYVYFESNGGSYVDTTELPYGDTLDLASRKPQRGGYAFDGWYLDVALTQRATQVVMGTQDITLYAAWKEGEGEYKVIAWLEQLEAGADGAYGHDYMSTYDRAAKVGSTVTAAQVKGGIQVPAGFEWDAAKNDGQSVTVDGSGETILNVYLKRKTITLEFYLYQYSSEPVQRWQPCSVYNHSNHWEWHGFLLFGWYEHKTSGTSCQQKDGEWGEYITEPAGETWVLQPQLTLTGRYGARVTGWPYTVGGENYSWRVQPSGSKLTYTPFVTFPSESVAAYGNKDANPVKYETFYCLQALPGQEADRKYNNTNYVFSGDSPIVQYLNGTNWRITEAEDCHEIAGFTYQRKYEDYDRNSKRDPFVAYIYYSRNSYEITFNPMGGAGAPDAIRAQYGAAVNAPAKTPVKAGYTFAGWYDNQQCEGAPFTFNTMPANNVGLFAKWTPVQYTVDFDLNAADAAGKPADQTVDYLATLTRPQDPQRPGYEFTGWYLTAAASGSKYIFDKPVTGGFTLYAGWQAKTTASYTVSYLNEAGKPMAAVTGNQAFAPKTVPNQKVGAQVTEFAVVVNGVKYLPYAISQTLTIQADDSKNEIVFRYKAFDVLPYKVQYLDEKGNALAPEKAVTDNEKVMVTENYLPVAGYSPDAYQKTVTFTAGAAENVIVFRYAQNQQVGYTVHYYRQTALNSDRYEAYQAADYTGTAAVGATVAAQEKAIAGYTLNPSMGKRSHTFVTADLERTVELHVYYDLNSFTVKYQANDGTSAAYTDPTRYAYNTQADVLAYNAAVMGFDAPAHHHFKEWNTKADGTGAAYAGGGKTPAQTGSGFELYAIWEQDSQYTVTYHSNLEPDTTQADPNAYYAGDTVTVAANAFVNPNPNQKFNGWNTKPDGTGTAYQPSGSLVMGQANLALYAQWIAKDQFSLTYHGNGGLTPNNQASVSLNFNEDATATVADNAALTKFARSGYDFAGWAYADGTPVAVGTAYTFADGSKDLYAQWTETAGQWFGVTYDGNGQTAGAAPTDSTRYRKNVTPVILMSPGALAKTDSLFIGWAETKLPVITRENSNLLSGVTLYQPAGRYGTISANKVFYAVWAEDLRGPGDGPDETPDYLQYAVTYQPNTATAGAAPVDDHLYDTGHKATVLGAATLEKEDHVFLGWTTSAYAAAAQSVTTQAQRDQITVLYAQDDLLTIGKADAALYAVWALDSNGNEIPDYEEFTVTYHANAPAGAQAEGSTPDGGLYPNGTMYTVKSNGFTVQNYVFVGWNTKADGTGTKAAPGAQVKLTDDLQLYAQWKLDENGPGGEPDEIPDEEEYKIVYDANGGVANTVPTDSNLYPLMTVKEEPVSVSVKFAPTPLRQDFVFLGWSLDKAAQTPAYAKQGVTLAPMADLIASADEANKTITLYAVWADDVVGGKDPEDGGDIGDGIPDMYQVRVDYRAVNGTVSPSHVYVTLYQRDEAGEIVLNAGEPVYGKPGEENVWGNLTANQLPAARPNSGYGNGGWSSTVQGAAQPKVDIDFTQAATFTITYTAVTTPPTDPDPTTPPATPTPVPVPVPEVPPAPPVAPVAPEEEIEDDDIPLVETPATPTPSPSPAPVEEEDIEDVEVPLAAGGAWALLNLILTILTVLGSLALVITYFTRKKQDQQEQAEARTEEERQAVKRRGMLRLASLIPALGAIIAFILTENMSLPMVFTDKWTILMAVIAVVQAVVMLLSRKKYEDGEDDGQQGAAPAGA